MLGSHSAHATHQIYCKIWRSFVGCPRFPLLDIVCRLRLVQCLFRYNQKQRCHRVQQLTRLEFEIELVLHVRFVQWKHFYLAKAYQYIGYTHS